MKNKKTITLTKKEWEAIIELVDIGIDEASVTYDEEKGKKILAKLKSQLVE